MEIKIIGLADRERYDHYINGYATQGSIGLDLIADSVDGRPMPLISYSLSPGELVKIGTGIAVNMGGSVGAFIFPRSGLGTKHGLVLANTVGVIDSDYQGEIIVALKNTSDKYYELKPGERIAQMCFLNFLKPELEFVKEFSNETQRGAGGFGSTGS